ncbi:MAG: ABC transporter permease [bacterium]|nr:ABC transporter permease [bacterium]MDE0289751.1 ABC transporter permease [bacterium]MDE0439810.1 ABC transporter permease [bacterium]
MDGLIWRFILRRLVTSVLVLWAVATLVFLLISLTPGNVAMIFGGLDARALGLDQPLAVQYGRYLSSLVQGDLGRSWLSGAEVAGLVADRAGPTLELALVTAVAATSIGLGVGLYTTVRRGRFGDVAMRVATVIGVSVPSFWLGLLLLMVFGLYIPDLLPAGGWIPFSVDPAGNLLHLVLPSAVLGLATVALVSRTLQVSMRDALQRDYVTFGRSAGLAERKVMRQVALPNAVLPTATVIGLMVGVLISGTVIVETVFTIPGVGRLLVQSLRNQDIPVATGATLFLATFFLLLNTAVDILYAWLDPRLRDLYGRPS